MEPSTSGGQDGTPQQAEDGPCHKHTVRGAHAVNAAAPLRCLVFACKRVRLLLPALGGTARAPPAARLARRQSPVRRACRLVAAQCLEKISGKQIERVR